MVSPELPPELPNSNGPAGWADHRAEADMWVRWWQNGPEAARRVFDNSRAEWLRTATGDLVPLWTIETDYDTQMHMTCLMAKVLTPAGQAYQAVESQGIGILPLLVDQIRAGDYGFLPIAFSITGGQPNLRADKVLVLC